MQQAGEMLQIGLEMPFSNEKSPVRLSRAAKIVKMIQFMFNKGNVIS
jgi:hypothetical protein